MGPPHRRYLVHQRQLGVTVLRHVQHREVIAQESLAVEAANQGKGGLDQRQTQRQNECKMSEFGNHGAWYSPGFIASATSGGM